MFDNRLTEPEVKSRIAACDESCIDELYSFGLMMVNESLDTLNKLDAKAFAVAGYSGATFGALISVSAFAKGAASGTVWPIAMILAAAAALGAAAFSLYPIWFR